jgi:hypothetical protein
MVTLLDISLPAEMDLGADKDEIGVKHLLFLYRSPR